MLDSAADTVTVQPKAVQQFREQVACDLFNSVLVDDDSDIRLILRTRGGLNRAGHGSALHLVYTGTSISPAVDAGSGTARPSSRRPSM